jgi:hypothetical protein
MQAARSRIADPLNPNQIRFPDTFQKQKDVTFISEGKYKVISSFFYTNSRGYKERRGFSCDIEIHKGGAFWNNVELSEGVCIGCPENSSDWQIDWPN